MRILVLGGTIFLGRHFVAAALEAGHTVTLFHRGKHNPRLFPQAEHVLGDRERGLGPLRGRTWDAAVDTSGYVPRIVGAAAQALAGAVEHYTFISSLSAYQDLAARDLDETAAIAALPAALPAGAAETVTAETYGPLKALCEEAAEAALPGRVLRVRPGLIVGPHDPSDRFTYWPHRVALGGEILAPGRRERLVQFIDARDLATWLLAMIKTRASGIYNVTGPRAPLTMEALLAACDKVSDGAGRFTWVTDQFLIENEVQPYVEAPLWVPGMDDTVDCARALAAGLKLRPTETTVRDTLAWVLTRPADPPLRAGFSARREIELLRRWSDRR